MRRQPDTQLEGSIVADPIGTAPSVDRYANLASRLTRLIATIVDFLLFALIAGIGRTSSDRDGAAALAGLLFLGLLAVQIILLGRDGQTIGKKLLAVRIVDANTRQHAGFFKAVVLRLLLNALLSLIPLYGIVDALLIFREDRRCLHDLIAGTVVVRA